MARDRKTRKTGATQAAYAAGSIGGDGTVTLSRLPKRENRRLVVAISNNEPPLLAFVKNVVGAGRITTLTLGLFMFVINGLLFWMAGSLLQGFVVAGFWPGVFGAIAYSLISWLLSSVLVDGGQGRPRAAD